MDKVDRLRNRVESFAALPCSRQCTSQHLTYLIPLAYAHLPHHGEKFCTKERRIYFVHLIGVININQWSRGNHPQRVNFCLCELRLSDLVHLNVVTILDPAAICNTFFFLKKIFNDTVPSKRFVSNTVDGHSFKIKVQMIHNVNPNRSSVV